MPRRARICLPNVPQHLIQRGNNRQACFVADEDFRFYLDRLAEYSDKTGWQVHAYVQYFNRTYRRSGTLWEGRYRSCPTQAEEYLLACQRYIELNPVRAGMIEETDAIGLLAPG